LQAYSVTVSSLVTAYLGELVFLLLIVYLLVCKRASSGWCYCIGLCV